MERLEKVEKIREKTGVSYEEAKNALEACEYDVLDALVYLETLGKINREKLATYSTVQTTESSEFTKAQETYENSCKDTSFGDETYILKLYNSKFFDVSFNKCYINDSNFGNTGGVFYIASSCNDGNAMSNVTNISAFPGTYVTSSCTNVKVAYNIPSETNNSK